MKKTIKIIILLSWPLYLNDLYLIILDNNRLDLLWILDIVFYLLIPMVTLIYLIRKKWISLEEIGLVLLIRTIPIISGLVLAPILIIIVDLYIRPYLDIVLPGHLFNGYNFPASQPWRWILMAYAAVTAGVLEEVVYRGVVISQLGKYIQSKIAVVLISSVIFGGIHWGEGPSIVISNIIWAIPLGFWFLKSKSLWGPIVCHIITDLLIYFGLMQMIYLYFVYQ